MVMIPWSSTQAVYAPSEPIRNSPRSRNEMHISTMNINIKDESRNLQNPGKGSTTPQTRMV